MGAKKAARRLSSTSAALPERPRVVHSRSRRSTRSKSRCRSNGGRAADPRVTAQLRSPPQARKRPPAWQGSMCVPMPTRFQVSHRPKARQLIRVRNARQVPPTSCTLYRASMKAASKKRPSALRKATTPVRKRSCCRPWRPTAHRPSTTTVGSHCSTCTAPRAIQKNLLPPTRAMRSASSGRGRSGFHCVRWRAICKRPPASRKIQPTPTGHAVLPTGSPRRSSRAPRSEN